MLIYDIKIIGDNRLEWQHRGSPHVHGVAWLHNAPNFEQALQDGDTSKKPQPIDCIDSVVCTFNPAVLPDGSNLDNVPCPSIDPHVCTVGCKKKLTFRDCNYAVTP